MTTTTSTTPSVLAFLDIETTSLYRNRRPWNIGMIRRAPDGTETAEEIIVRGDDMIWDADPASLLVGHFWQRHPDFGGDPGDAEVLDEDDALAWLLERVRPTLTAAGEAVPVHIVGAVPSFDVWTCERWFRMHQLTWPAHYHLVCAENVALGALAARGVVMRPPYSSTELSVGLGLDLSRYAKHTALGDAQWARDLYDAAMSPIPAIAERKPAPVALAAV